MITNIGCTIANACKQVCGNNNTGLYVYLPCTKIPMARTCKGG